MRIKVREVLEVIKVPSFPWSTRASTPRANTRVKQYARIFGTTFRDAHIRRRDPDAAFLPKHGSDVVALQSEAKEERHRGDGLVSPALDAQSTRQSTANRPSSREQKAARDVRSSNGAGRNTLVARRVFLRQSRRREPLRLKDDRPARDARSDRAAAESDVMCDAVVETPRKCRLYSL